MANNNAAQTMRHLDRDAHAKAPPSTGKTPAKGRQKSTTTNPPVAQSPAKLALCRAFDTTRIGAGKRSRTSDLRITNAPLYQLSYPGAEPRILRCGTTGRKHGCRTSYRRPGIPDAPYASTVRQVNEPLHSQAGTARRAFRIRSGTSSKSRRAVPALRGGTRGTCATARVLQGGHCPPRFPPQVKNQAEGSARLQTRASGVPLTPWVAAIRVTSSTDGVRQPA